MSTTTTTTTNPSASLTTTSSSAPPNLAGDVTAPLNFYVPPPDNAKPFNYVETPPAGTPQRNYTVTSHDVLIHDIRSHESSYNLDRDAFQALPSTSVPPSALTYTSWDDDTAIRSTYYAEITSLLLTHLPGSHKITIFDHTIRRSSPSAARAPVARTHVDQTSASALARVKLHAASPEDAEHLLQGRYRIVNVWRPINGRVEASPLAFASATTVDDGADLVPVEHRYPERTGETAQVRYSEGMRWYYWSGMEDGERLLLKCWDSRDRLESGGGEVGKCVPHTAFVDPRQGEGAKGRESIEVRALVFG